MKEDQSDGWVRAFRYNPLPSLLKGPDEAVSFFARRDLLEEPISVENLWGFSEPQRILRKQALDGSWKYPGGNQNIRTEENYNQIETYRNLGILVEEFGFNKKHPAIQNAAEFLFKFQTKEGDFRGIYGNQYSPNYTAGITELLIKAGYENDPRIENVFRWLLSIRQKDGGWAIPFRTRKYNLDIIVSHSQTVEPDTSKPSSYMVTGVVLRAFAAHPTYRKSKAARQAGDILLSGLFKKDHYPDRAGAEFWLRFSFPFWFTDLISAMDSLSLLRLPKTIPHVSAALEWFTANQQSNGLWKLKVLKGHNRDILNFWLALAICRIFKRYEPSRT